MLTLTEIHKLSDVNLLGLLCSSSDDELLYEQFVRRFLKDVEDECTRLCKRRKLDTHVGLQIAHETFERIRKYKSFKSDQIKLSNERKAIQAYLNRISTSLFNNYHASNRNKETNHKTYFEDILDSIECSPADVKALKNQKDLSILIFKKLNAKEQKIILTDLEYKRHHKYLPDDVIDVLAEELNIKRDTIRKIRERAIEKIKNAINEINQ